MVRSSNKATIHCTTARRTDEHKRQGDNGGARSQVNIPGHSLNKDPNVTMEHEETTQEALLQKYRCWHKYHAQVLGYW